MALVAALVASLLVSDLIWLPFSPVRPDPHLLLDKAIATLPLVFLWVVLGAMRYQLRKTPFRYREMLDDFAGRVQALLTVLGIIILATIGLLLISYLASATRRPLLDGYLAAGDAALGFDWVRYVKVLNNHPSIASAVSLAYRSLEVQILLLPAILAFTGRSKRLLEFAAYYALAGCLTCLVLVVVPAAGAFDFYHPAPDLLSSFGPGASTRHLEQLHALRMLKPFLIDNPEGLVTFPSFHSALAAMFVYSVRGIRYIAPPIYVLNAMLILATPPQGGHYLVDVLGGFAIAAVSIQIVCRAGGGRKRQQADHQDGQAAHRRKES